MFVVLIVSLFISVFLDHQRSLSLVVPATVLLDGNFNLSKQLLADDIYLAVDSFTELQELAELGIVPQERVICRVFQEPPDYTEQCFALQLAGLNGRILQMPSGALPKDKLILALELTNFSDFRPELFADNNFHWIHGFFTDELDILGQNREFQRWKRAFRERGLRFFYLDPFLHNSPKLDYTSFVKRWDKLRQHFTFEQYRPVKYLFSDFWRYVLLVSCLLFLGFIHWIFLFTLVFLFLPFPFSVQALAFSFQLCSVFYIYKKLSALASAKKWPWFLSVLPLLIFAYSLLLGGVYYFLLAWPEFQQRIYLPRGIKISLFGPFLLVIAYEFLLLLRQNGWKKGLQEVLAARFLLISALGFIFLTLLLIRSGNQTVLPIAELELYWREYLENMLLARPRSREIFFYLGLCFFIPAVKTGGFFWSILGKSSLILLLSSIFNTFSHLHTPWWLVVFRVFNAFWLSWLLLLLLCAVLMRQKRQGILHLGYFGFANFGDELLKLAVEQRFSSEKNIFMAGNLPSENNVTAVYRRNLSGVLGYGSELKTFSLGPGGILQDQTSFLSLLYYLACCWFFRLFCGMRIIWTGQGVSPFRYWLSGRLVFVTAFLVDEIQVRDEDSFLVLTGLGVSKQKISVSPDLVFNFFEYKFLDHEKGLGNFPANGTLPKVGIVLRTWAGFDPTCFLQLMSEQSFLRTYYLFQPDDCLANLIRKYDAEAVLLTFGIAKNVPYHTAQEGDIVKFLSFFYQNQAFISMRYHGLVLALKAGLPVLPLIYEQKCLNLAQEHQIFPYIDMKNWHDRERLTEIITAFLLKLQPLP